MSVQEVSAYSEGSLSTVSKTPSFPALFLPLVISFTFQLSLLNLVSNQSFLFFRAADNNELLIRDSIEFV